MPAPWAGFGTFQFRPAEKPIIGTDSGWNRQSSHVEVRTANLGVQDPSYIRPAQRGNATRTWECFMSYARFAILQQYQNMRETLVTWDRPIPEEKLVYFRTATQVARDLRGSRMREAGDQRVVRVRVEFMETA